MSARKGYGIIAACTLAMMNNIGTGPSIAVALPDIGRDLDISAANLQWIISAYSLTSVCIPSDHLYLLVEQNIDSFSSLYRYSGLLPNFFTTTHSIYVHKHTPPAT